MHAAAAARVPSAPPPTPPLAYDVLVVGGGPGGSATATALARQGRRVALVEKDRHPRFHIGESLLPMSMPLFEELGVREAVERIGVIKRGADFPSATPGEYTVFRFTRTLHPTCAYAVQVRRQDLDELLFATAREAGVATVQDTEIESVRFDADGVEASGHARDGSPVAFRARYLVDATGRDTLLGRQLGLKRRNRRFQSAALFAHFEGVRRREGEHEGNISIYRVDDGWVWVIPLPDGITSIGLVCGPDTLRQRAGERESFLLRLLAGIPGLAERLDAPRIVGHLQATGNYSYQCTRVVGRRWIMVGDSAAFIDPIFSAGVHVALNAAQKAARLVNTVLDDPALERRLQRDYVREQRRGLERVRWFIERFNAPVMKQLFAHPRNDWRLEEAIVSMLAGDLYRDDGIVWRLRLFKLIYYAHCLADLKGALAGVRQRWKRVREVFAADALSPGAR
ncbi:MAG: tryptophan 7-halogenase [Proteobacteria bacterium]|nr:tryptophan 7-halogenase [Pseudomonadota bacterium]